MPIYAYKCQSCGDACELLVRSSDVPVCAACGSANLERQIAKVCGVLKTPGIAKASREAAGRAGHLSNFSKSER